MQLDYYPSTKYFTVKVPRSEHRVISSLMTEHGLDYSQAATTPSVACLMTKEPYAACAFAADATPGALAQLAPILGAINASWKSVGISHIACPAGEELWPFQVASVEYALQRKHTLVGDQPGLGKTPIAICFANEIRAQRILVLCPANIRIQWVNRIRQWSTMRWPYHVYPVLSGKHGVHPQAHWTVVSYDLARTEAIGRALAQYHYDLVILDEAHYLKTIDTGRTHAVFGDLETGMCREPVRSGAGDIIGHRDLFPAITSKAERVMALTGTPLPNRPREAYVIARNLCWDAIDWYSEATFKQAFNPSARMTGTRNDGTEYMYTREEVGRIGELQARLRGNFMVRHLKRDVMPQLNLPAYNLVRVEDTKATREALEAEGLLDIDPDTFDGTIEVNGMWAEVRHQLGIAIAPQVADYAAMCIDGGEEKLVIFAWHKAVLDILQAKLERFHPLRIDGSTSTSRRQYIVNDMGTGVFQTDPKHQILLGNTMALGVGTDGLQMVSCHALLAEPDPVPGANEQAIDRLDRGGQKRTVQADLFVVPKSLLERILAKALEKRHNTHAALDRRAA
jgi:hypothetical protein